MRKFRDLKTKEVADIEKQSKGALSFEITDNKILQVTVDIPDIPVFQMRYEDYGVCFRVEEKEMLYKVSYTVLFGGDDYGSEQRTIKDEVEFTSARERQDFINSLPEAVKETCKLSEEIED